MHMAMEQATADHVKSGLTICQGTKALGVVLGVCARRSLRSPVQRREVPAWSEPITRRRRRDGIGAISSAIAQCDAKCGVGTCSAGQRTSSTRSRHCWARRAARDSACMLS